MRANNSSVDKAILIEFNEFIFVFYVKDWRLHHRDGRYASRRIYRKQADY